MRALLDTNIIIHREASRVVNRDIGTLFKWLDKGKYTKCIHPVTIEEIAKNSNQDTAYNFNVKLDSYEKLKTIAPLNDQVKAVSDGIDATFNDKNDTLLLNEVYCDRVDLLVTEDRKIHEKSVLLGISDRVFTIDSFLEKVVSENPELVNYKVLSVTKKHFGDINLQDSFFDGFREDYVGFDKWFNKKSDETAYVTYHKDTILSFLYLKIEGHEENYADITPAFSKKKRLKVGTFKVVSNGVRLGERFLKIIFDNAFINKVDEIYVTIFDKRDDEKRLITLFEDWGFKLHGKKLSSSGKELVYVRSFKPAYDSKNPKYTYPYLSRRENVFLVSIRPPYHTELLPDSILKTESPGDFIDNEPHRNAISKVYISRSLEKGLGVGDLIIFYRTGGYYEAVISTIGIVEKVIIDIKDEQDFINKCRKRSIFTDEELKEHWNFNKAMRPFIVNFLYAYSFPKRIILKDLIDLGIIKNIESAPRGFTKITTNQFNIIMRETKTDESIVVD
ncbi:MAG: PIN domain-containing protein [Deltaproteobacteria bacterium]|nr:PIN domain-containing protein [Deltaproteobacteria bacterium]